VRERRRERGRLAFTARAVAQYRKISGVSSLAPLLET
jgi:hypothetical protein